MTPLVDSILFLVGIYWPFMLVAGVAGMAVGWVNLARRAREDAP